MNFSEEEVNNKIIFNCDLQHFDENVIQLITKKINNYDGDRMEVLMAIKEEFKDVYDFISYDLFSIKIQNSNIAFILDTDTDTDTNNENRNNNINEQEENDKKDEHHEKRKESNDNEHTVLLEMSPINDSCEHKPLTQKQAEEKILVCGKNVITDQTYVPWYILLGYCIVHPFNILLFILAIISISTQDYATFSVMIIMIILSTSLRFVQELKSQNDAAALKNMVKNKACVIRIVNDAEHEMEILMEDIVPGDVVKICAGDMVPGDIMLFESKDLFISQSSLTGESLPVEKFVSDGENKINETNNNNNNNNDVDKETKNNNNNDVDKETKNNNNNNDVDKEEKMKSLDNPTLCFLGSNVVSGIGKGVVLKTGQATLFGELAKQLATSSAPTAFQVGIKKVSYMFLGVMAVIIPFVFVISGLVGGVWMNSFLFAISVAVGLTPEMLPMIVNGNLARGAIVMARQKCIVKQMESIINLGSMNILCTDKTGTLTQDKVVLLKHINITGESDEDILTMAFLNSYYQTGLKNLLDIAVIERFKKDLNVNIALNYTVIDEIPFDFVRRRMSVALQYFSNDKSIHQILISKGAVDEMLNVCSRIKYPNGTIEEINGSTIQNVKDLSTNLCKDGLRVIAVAIKHIKDNDRNEIKEENLTLLGFIAFLDPPKESAAIAIKELMEKQITIKVLTGDSPVICNNICNQVNLPVNGIITSSDLNNIDDEKLSEIAEKNTIFAKLTPLQKQKIVQVLRKKNIVGFLGDGINDAAALKEADVGISVDSGTDVAKENANMILLQKDLMVLAKGVRIGRKTYANTIKYIKMAVSSNFGNVFSILIACSWLPFLPMKPLQILIQNLLYDFSQIAIPWDNVDASFIATPRKWDAKGILKFMIPIGPISSIFDMTTFCLMWFYYGIQTPSDNVDLFQTAWFVEGLITQTFIVHMIRTEKIPFIQSIASIQLIFGTFCCIAVGIAIPFIPYFNTTLGMKPLPGLYFAYLVGVVLGYAILIQIAKTIFIRVFKMWM